MSADDLAEDEQHNRPFTAWLREVQNGRTHEELTEKLADVVAAVRETGKAGKLQLTLTIKPMKGNVDMLLVDDTVVVKAPQHDRKSSLFFPDENGNLTRSDPNQLTFDEPLKAVASKDEPVKNIKENQA
ncbi:MULTISPECIES: hypothetical protein [unclassified Aeromicrobium]|uniref:hypothetical protein n=1 Tax=unclassified Aeromicrobium TaxID=2633570 RepID=UPI00288B84CA|nr:MULTISPECIES: hypothetical protein [unclassified Aeromicrobium]